MNNTNLVPKPWSPITVDETANGFHIGLTNKTYEIKDSVLFSSIKAQGKELLSAPIRIVSSENGEASVWQESQVFMMEDSNEEYVDICATANSDNFYINTAMHIEYDGCVKVDVKIMPRGLWVKETIFGATKKREYNLDSFWVEIPLRKEVAFLYQMCPHHMPIYLADGTEKSGGFLSSGDYLPKINGSVDERIGQFMLTDDEVGLGCFFEDKKNWQPKDEKSYLEFINDGDQVILRIRFLDSHPKKWVHAPFMSDMNAYSPLTFSFGLQTLPLRTFPKNPYEEHTIHIDCFKKLDNDYEEFLSQPFCYDDGTLTDETVYDRFQRLGVNALYLHEKWNTFQNSVSISTVSANRLRTIVSECHKRNIKVIPYFGYEMSSLLPQYSEHIDEIVAKNENGNYRSTWNRVPYQRDPSICYNSYWQDIFADGIEKLIKEYHFDGIYLDTTVTINACTNQEHGCGYYDQNGVLRPTYAFWASRNLIKKLYAIAEKYNVTISCHTSASYSLSAISHCHSLLEGEAPQNYLVVKGAEEALPEGLFRSNYTGRQFGIPIHFIVYENAPIWTFDNAFTYSILMGTYPKSVDVGLPLEKMSKLWNIIDNYPINNAEWHPYWNNELVDISDDRVKCSYYEYVDLLGNKNLLMFVGNIVKENIENVEIRLKGDYTIKQLMPLAAPHTGGVNVDFEPFGHYIFAAEIIEN